MKKTQTPAARRPLLLAALCLCAAAAAARPSEGRAEKFEPTPAQAAGAARLRGALASAVGGHFEVTRGRLARRSDWHGGGLYWLAHLRALRPGGFSLTYGYSYTDRARPRDPAYTFVERRTYFRVGPRGCPRRPRRNSVCVGDTIILPVVFDEHTGHTFSFEPQPYAPPDGPAEEARRAAEDARLYREPVHNPAGEFLRYVGRRAEYIPHRALGYTMHLEATFEAVRPGSFNLSVVAGAPAAGPQAGADAPEARPVPVVVVGPETPLTILSVREDVRGYNGRFSSSSGNEYRTTTVLLQVGERLTLQYLSYSHRGRSAGGESEDEPGAAVGRHPPSVALLPFRADPAQDFDEWLVEFLPPARRD